MPPRAFRWARLGGTPSPQHAQRAMGDLPAGLSQHHYDEVGCRGGGDAVHEKPTASHRQ